MAHIIHQRYDMESKKRRQSMTRPQILKCCTWLTTNWDMLKGERLASAVLCERIVTETSCHVSISEVTLKRLVSDMGKDVSEITPLRKNRKRGDPDHANTRAIQRYLAMQVSLAQQVLRSLCEQLGHNNPLLEKMLPDWLRSYASGKESLKTLPENDSQPSSGSEKQ